MVGKDRPGHEGQFSKRCIAIPGPAANGFAEAGLHGSARERLLVPLAKTYQLASLTPLGQLFSRTIASRESETSSAALAAAQGLFTLQGFTSRLQVW